MLAEATRPVAGAERPFDVVLVVDAAELPHATELATRLRGLGLKVWPEKGPLPPVAELVPTEVIPAVRMALVLVGGVDIQGPRRRPRLPGGDRREPGLILDPWRPSLRTRVLKGSRGGAPGPSNLSTIDPVNTVFVDPATNTVDICRQR